MSTSETPRTVICARPSQLFHVLAKANGLLIIDVADQPRSIEGLVSVMPHLRLRAIVELDFGRLERFDRKEVPCDTDYPTVMAAFYRALPDFTGLTRLHLGTACLDQASRADATGKWDVDYLLEAIPNFKALRKLDLRELELTASDGWDILKACSKCPSLKELDLAENSLHNLSDVVEDQDVVCHLESLDLGGNALGEFGEDSVGCDETCHALIALITQYTSLRELDLSGNAMHDREGLAIAEALAKTTHLTELYLAANYWSDEVDKQITQAWRGEADSIVL